MRTPEVRFIHPGETRSWLRAEQRSFGIEPSEDRLDELIETVEVDRACAAVEGGDIVATGGAFSTRMHLPGGASVPVAGITAIGTRPTHTRRGLFRAIMGQLHEQSSERDEAAAVLLASESLLYPRFGYGRATTGNWVQLDRRRVQFRPDAPITDRVEMFIDVATAHALVDGIWRRVGPHRPGWLHRPGPLLDLLLADHPTDRHGAMAFTLAVHHDAAGTPDGYCLYRRRLHWMHGQSTGSLFMHELVATDESARLSLWHHCLSIDLVETVEAMPVPDDDPLPEALVDPRQFRTIGLHDQLWIRPADISALLEARRFQVEDRAVIDVSDHGRIAVEGAPDGARVDTTDATADLTMSRAELGALALGRSLRPLVAVGRVDVADPALLDRWDRFFRWPVAPYNLLDF